jgi:uncharacterized membrane protein YkvA (DUF1232 family)
MPDELPFNGNEFSSYPTYHAAQMTIGELDRLDIASARKEFSKFPADKLEQARARFNLLARLLQAFQGGAARSYSFKTIVEAAVALAYLQRSVDVIPDALPDIGLLDDSIIAQTVFERNADQLESFAIQEGVDWKNVSP